MLNMQKNERTKSERAIRTLKKNRNGAGLANKIPTGLQFEFKWIIVNPALKCKLRYVQLQRVYDYLQIENEYIKSRLEAKKNEVKDDVTDLVKLWQLEGRDYNRNHPRIASYYLHRRGDRGWWSCNHQYKRHSGILSRRCLFRWSRSLGAGRIRIRHQHGNAFHRLFM